MFGRMWRSGDPRAASSPSARAASTYSSVLIASTVPRASRTKVGRAAMPIAIMALPRPGPRNAASAMATMRNGIASMASLMRIISPSTQPPTEPERRPSGTLSASAMVTGMTPASSDARAPQIRRDSTSRPTSSVPSRCAADGGFRIAR